MMANKSSSADLKQRLEGKFKRVFKTKKKKNNDDSGEASRDDAEAMPVVALINSSISHSIPPPVLSNIISLKSAQSSSSLPRSSLSRSEGNLMHVPIKELWSLAYERLKMEDPTLVEDYERKLQGNVSTALIPPLGVKENVREQMDVILRKKMDEVTQNAWKLKFGGAEIQMRDLLPPILAIISHANDYITTSLNTNMYASIAWAGVSLLLPRPSSISFKRVGQHFFAYRAEPYAGRTVSSPL
ncbi:hypothetical protein Trisim1_002036 [Trichoderma cf. simile WF8]